MLWRARLFVLGDVLRITILSGAKYEFLTKISFNIKSRFKFKYRIHFLFVNIKLSKVRNLRGAHKMKMLAKIIHQIARIEFENCKFFSASEGAHKMKILAKSIHQIARIEFENCNFFQLLRGHIK